VVEGHTIDISRQGATIKVDRELFAGEIIKVQRLDGGGKEVMARVIGRVARGSEGHLFGLTILDPAVANPWGIVFPAVADMDNAVLRAFVRCVSCERTEVAYLNESPARIVGSRNGAGKGMLEYEYGVAYLHIERAHAG
jgi:hypothetical protein